MCWEIGLTLKVPSKILADDILKFFIFYFSEKTSLDIHVNCLPKSSAAWQTIHMKYQDLFSSENKKKLKFSSVLVVIGALRIKLFIHLS